MRKLISLFIFLCALKGFAQQPYYDDVDLEKTGFALMNELAQKITNTHTNFLEYTPEVWEALKITDQDPNNGNDVILIYGWENGSDSDITNDKSRNKDKNGGNVGDWNREHTYPKSLGNPNLGESGPGSDAHHLRPSDVQRNSNRGNRKFAAGSGNSKTVGEFWYPGDEFKGDIARMMMYMYVRYGDRCLPRNVAQGNPNDLDSNMINLLLDWNAQDPVSEIEDNRNTYHDSNAAYAQGNRNPFIDNPYLATAIWGGPAADDRWGTLASSSQKVATFLLWPNPAHHYVTLKSIEPLEAVSIYDTTGKLIATPNSTLIDISNLDQGLYFIHVSSVGKKQTLKLMVH